MTTSFLAGFLGKQRLWSRLFREPLTTNWQDKHEFSLGGVTYPYFFHRFNAGWPPERCTERIVELALADAWLHEIGTDDAIEIGAVTPYYWPHRVKSVVDPADKQCGVTDRRSLFDVDLTGKNVISISTIEHVGLSEYGFHEQHADHNAIAALRKIVDEAAKFLITMPLGYNPQIDSYATASMSQDDTFHAYFLIRVGNFQWTEVQDPRDACVPYGDPDWANALVVVERGGLIGTNQHA